VNYKILKLFQLLAPQNIDEKLAVEDLELLLAGFMF